MNTTTDKLNKLLETKEAIKTAIIGKNVAVADSDPFSVYASKIESISTDGGTGGSGLDWSEIGYSEQPQSLTDGFNYAKQIYNNWNMSDTINYFGDGNLVYFPLVDTVFVTTLDNSFGYCSALQELPLINTSNVISMTGAFTNCSSLKSIPLLDTSNVTNFNQAFAYCKLLQEIPELNTSNATQTYAMFSDCTSLARIPLLDTSKVENMSSMFANCYALETIPELNTSNAVSVESMFSMCPKIDNLPLLDFTNVANASNFLGYNWDTNMAITTLAGFHNLRINFDVSNCINLTAESLMNIINEALDLTVGGLMCTLTLGTTNVEKLTEEQIAVATAKGWTIA